MDQVLRRRRELIDRERALFDGRVPSASSVPSDVANSWTRCAPRVAAAMAAAPLDAVDVDEAWSESLINRAGADVIGELGRVALDHDYVCAVTDGAGRILWSNGGPSMRRAAHKVNFVTGGVWDERRSGTNAPGLALVTGRPATVFATEHWCESVSDWVCYAAPVRGPDGDVVGVVDLSSTWKRANPLALTTVSTLARLIEQQMAIVEPRSGARLRLLGTPSLTLYGLEIPLTPRQCEILAVLVDRPATLEELHAYVYGDRAVAMSTLKAELSHLRGLFGGQIGSRPYRLTLDVWCDYVALLGALRTADLVTAMRLYRGPLLPRSESPFVEDERNHIDVALRDAVLRWGATEDLLAFGAVHPYDVEVLERLRGAQRDL